MDLSIKDIKKILYCFQTILGVLLLCLSMWVLRQAFADSDPLRYLIPVIVLAIVGTDCILYGIETFVRRNEPETWR